MTSTVRILVDVFRIVRIIAQTKDLRLPPTILSNKPFTPIGPKHRFIQTKLLPNENAS